ncbi:kininogen-1 [Aplochiton taeniatus]
MRLGLRLCVLGMLCLHGCAGEQKHLDVPIDAARVQTLVFCDDPVLKRAVYSALDEFNERLVRGSKMALYQILQATKFNKASGSVYNVLFNSRISDCAAGGDKPWLQCDYLAGGPSSPTPCNATVFVTETETVTEDVHCQPADQSIVPERAPCLGCPEEIDVESGDLKVPLSISIARFNSVSDSTHLFLLNSVGFATRQVIAGFRYMLVFDMRKSTCAKSEHKQLSDQCVPHAEDIELANCNSTVDVAPWRHEVPEANVECGPGPMPPMVFTRRRPPGWSPLRNIINYQQHTSTPSPTKPPSKAPSQVSSEEEQDKCSQPPREQDPEQTGPFRCPAKPWKKFVPQAAPTIPEAEITTAQPTVEGAFSDFDLLG